MNLGDHPACMVLAITVAATFLSAMPIGIRIPIVVWEILFGALLGPHLLGLARDPQGPLWNWFSLAGLGALLFMAGMELDFGYIRGSPIKLAMGGWLVSLLLGLVSGVTAWRVGIVNSPVIMALALSTTAIGTILPSLRDSGVLHTSFGTNVLAAGAVGEFAPVLAISLALTHRFSAWTQCGFLIGFTAIAVSAAITALRFRPLKILQMLSDGMHSSSQLPICFSLLIVVALCVLADSIGFEAVVGAFAGGMVVGLATRGHEAEELFRHKMEAICFAVFIPFFFVVSGMKLDIPALLGSPKAMMLVPVFAGLFLLVRGLPAVIYVDVLSRRERIALALYSSTALPMVVVIAAIAVNAKMLSNEIATALIGAGLLSVLVFPILADIVLAKSDIFSKLELQTASASAIEGDRQIENVK